MTKLITFLCALTLFASAPLFADGGGGNSYGGGKLSEYSKLIEAEKYAQAIARLGEALRQYGRATFRLYRTAAGLRAIAIDREFDPAGRDAQDLMAATGTDPAFMRLCLAQKSFRARLTPKPWRCDTRLPPGEHPRTDDHVRAGFVDWLADYERAAASYATCQYIETIGSGTLKGAAEKLVALHDRVTRCEESLPLA